MNEKIYNFIWDCNLVPYYQNKQDKENLTVLFWAEDLERDVQADRQEMLNRVEKLSKKLSVFGKVQEYSFMKENQLLIKLN